MLTNVQSINCNNGGRLSASVSIKRYKSKRSVSTEVDHYSQSNKTNKSKQLTQNNTVHDVVFNSFDAQCSSSTSQQHIKYYGGSNILVVYYSFFFQRLIHLCYI